MKNKLIMITLVASLCLGSTSINAQNPHPNGSPARRIGFFLLHGLCTVGGFNFTVGSAATAILSAAIRRADPVEVERIRVEKLNEYIREHGYNPEADQKTRDIIEYFQRPSTVPIASTCAVAGTAVTIYGIQGLFKDFFSLFK